MAIKLPKIFLDSGDPTETKKAKGIIGLIDGQTTNPTLISKHPEAQKFMAGGKKMTEEELLSFYKDVVIEIEKEIAGPISVEVHADWDTKAEDMLSQAHKMFAWGRNIYVKFPTINEGVKAAHEFVKTGGRVNMTLVFTQTQAAAAYSATLVHGSPFTVHGPESGKKDVQELTTENRQLKSAHLVSPFMGRYDDRGYHGLDLLKNIMKMYKHFDKQRNSHRHHLQVLASSVRTLDHFYGAIFLGADAVTVPLSVLKEWIEDHKWVPDGTYRIDQQGLKSIKYEDISFNPDFTAYDIVKEEGSLLDEGLKKFAADWLVLQG